MTFIPIQYQIQDKDLVLVLLSMKLYCIVDGLETRSMKPSPWRPRVKYLKHAYIADRNSQQNLESFADHGFLSCF